MAWIPQRWKDGHVEAVAQRVEELGWGPVHQFEHLGQTLLIAPRAIPKNNSPVNWRPWDGHRFPLN